MAYGAFLIRRRDLPDLKAGGGLPQGVREHLQLIGGRYDGAIVLGAAELCVGAAVFQHRQTSSSAQKSAVLRRQFAGQGGAFGQW